MGSNILHAETEQLAFHSNDDPLSSLLISLASHIVIVTAGTSQPLLHVYRPSWIFDGPCYQTELCSLYKHISIWEFAKVIMN